SGVGEGAQSQGCGQHVDRHSSRCGVRIQLFQITADHRNRGRADRAAEQFVVAGLPTVDGDAERKIEPDYFRSIFARSGDVVGIVFNPEVTQLRESIEGVFVGGQHDDVRDSRPLAERVADYEVRVVGLQIQVLEKIEVAQRPGSKRAAEDDQGTKKAVPQLF